MRTEDEVKDTNDVTIRQHAIDRVIDAGGEVLTATVEHGAVRLRGQVGMHDDIELIERLLRTIDGVTEVDARFTVGGEHGNRGR